MYISYCRSLQKGGQSLQVDVYSHVQFTISEVSLFLLGLFPSGRFFFIFLRFSLAKTRPASLCRTVLHEQYCMKTALYQLISATIWGFTRPIWRVQSALPWRWSRVCTIYRCQLVTLRVSIRHFATDDCLTRWSLEGRRSINQSIVYLFHQPYLIFQGIKALREADP